MDLEDVLVRAEDQYQATQRAIRLQDIGARRASAISWAPSLMLPDRRRWIALLMLLRLLECPWPWPCEWPLVLWW